MMLRTTMTVDAVSIRLTPPSSPAAAIADHTPGSIQVHAPVGYGVSLTYLHR